MHISSINFKLRHICVFSIKKTYEFKKKSCFFRYDGIWKIFNRLFSCKKLNLKFIDIDNIIEKEVGMKIADIFKDKGENYFRILEERNTLKVLNFNNSVISLGGGAFCK